MNTFYFVFARNATPESAASHAAELPGGYRHSDRNMAKADFLRRYKSGSQRKKMALWAVEGGKARVAF